MNDEREQTPLWMTLRAFIAVAVQRTEARDTDGAVAAYNEAADVCASASLRVEEALVLLSLAGVWADAKDYSSALACYGTSGRLADGCSVPIEYLAWMGAASIHVASQNHECAVEAYVIAAQVAEHGGLESLRVSALRLAATFTGLMGAVGDALRLFQEVASLAAVIGPERERAESCQMKAVLEVVAMRLGFPANPALQHVTKRALD